MILQCNFVSRRLCRESALRAKHDEQNVKVGSRGAGEQLEHYGEGRRWRRGTLCRLRRTKVEAKCTLGGALCGAAEDGGATEEQVAIHLESLDLHPSIHACTQIPMLMTRRVLVIVSRVSSSI